MIKDAAAAAAAASKYRQENNPGPNTQDEIFLILHSSGMISHRTGKAFGLISCTVI